MIVEPLPYEPKLQTRPLERIDLAVIHCTELPDLAAAREYGERILYDSGTGNSGHYYIDRDGSVHRWIEPTCIAHHVRGCNERAIGIELVNAGRYPDWLASNRQHMTEAYAEAQIDALVALLHGLQLRIPTLRYIAGHEDLDREQVPASDDPAIQVRRKLDPGSLFPWQRVLREVRLERLASPDAPV
ncbi:MAG: N-acetylmuramoyl-L-alanine amidase [Pseudoxanthomonas sp.]